jgi:hypothetical protein
VSHSCDEYYDVYEERRRVARKAHECDACDLPVRPGDLYYAISIVWDGSAETVKRCARCQLMHEHLRGLAPNEMWPSEKLDCGEEYSDHWGHEPPEWVAALAFWMPGDPLPAREPCTVLPGWYAKPELKCHKGWELAAQCRTGGRWGHDRSHQEACS